MVSALANGLGEHVHCSTTDVAIVGGGLAGVLAAMRMRERGIMYRVIERLHDFGGTWQTHANNYSTLQVSAMGCCCSRGVRYPVRAPLSPWPLLPGFDGMPIPFTQLHGMRPLE